MNTRRIPPSRWLHGAAWVAAAAGLTAVFLAYLRPGLMMSLANQLWSCF